MARLVFESINSRRETDSSKETDSTTGRAFAVKVAANALVRQRTTGPSCTQTRRGVLVRGEAGLVLNTLFPNEGGEARTGYSAENEKWLQCHEKR